VNILDENITRDQADLLRAWGVACRSLARDCGKAGLGDEDIIPFLLTLKRPCFLTRDEDFFQRHLLHARYCLAWFNVATDETAFFIRRFLRHPLFRTQEQRLGKVIRVHASGLEYWARGAARLTAVDWSELD
jgi:hypothetical protein